MKYLKMETTVIISMKVHIVVSKEHRENFPKWVPPSNVFRTPSELQFTDFPLKVY